MRILLLASGSGTLTQAVLDAAGPYSVVAVGSDLPDAPVLRRAQQAGVDDFCVDFSAYEDRSDWNRALADVVEGYQPDWIVSAGLMRILGPEFVSRFAGKIINTHPALLPSFPGAHAVRDALDHGVHVTGTTIHLIDEGVDTGPIIRQFPIEISPTDTEETLHEKIKEVERAQLVRLLSDLATHSLSLNGRRVTLTPVESESSRV